MVAPICGQDSPNKAKPLDLFDVPEGTVRAWQSSQPSLLPPDKPQALDLFSLTPSPTVEALKSHAEKRLLPGADRPIVVGMCCDGVIANYDEAYRLSLKTGKPLRVLSKQPMDLIVRQGRADDGYLKVRVDDDPRFPVQGVFEFKPQNQQLWKIESPTSARYDATANQQATTPGYKWQCDEKECRRVPDQPLLPPSSPPPAAQYQQPALNPQPQPIQFWQPRFQPMTAGGSFCVQCR